jgi:hypothetical protein
MLTLKHKKRLVVAAGALATVGAIAAVSVSPATADPKQYTALVGVGSDTTQDVTNALAGFQNNAAYPPVYSSPASGARPIVSFDATNPDPNSTDVCITPKIGSPNFNRPNGSTNGRRALSRAIDATNWGTAACGGGKNIQGQVDFARSSAGPESGDTGTALTYIPLALDALSLGYYRAGVTPPNSVTSTSSQLKTRWTRAEITQLFTGSGVQTFVADDGVTNVSVMPCGIQTGSGTFQFWNTVTTASTSQENTATGTCNSLIDADPATAGIQPKRAQENDALELKARGDLAPAGTQVVIGFSAGGYVAKANNVATPNPLVSNVGLATITNDGTAANLGIPFTVSGTTYSPSQSFYASTTFGRTVYNVVSTTQINSLFGNTALKSLFKDDPAIAGNEATLCAATATIQTFGFLVAPNCGSTSLTGSLIANS